MRSNGNLMLGISIVLIGVLFFLNAQGNFDGAFVEYWPVLLIVLGFVSWITQGRKPSSANVIIVTIGVILLIGKLNRWNATEFLWPVLFILIGINLAIGPKVRDKFLR
jgi:hypothetical protein